MQRPTKFIRIIVVAVSICLLTVDPAAACRLLGGRRCCCVCSPCETACQAMSCTTAVPAQGTTSDESKTDVPAQTAPPTAALPSPSDAPPGASTGGGTLRPSQEPRPNNDQSRSGPTRSTSPEPAAVKSTTTLTFGEPQQPSPANLDRTATEPAVIHEPAAGPLSAAPGPRDPAAINPVATEPIKAPSAASGTSAPSVPALAHPSV